MQRMGRIEAKFDLMVWDNLCTAAARMRLTPAELVDALKEVIEAIEAGSHPVQALVAAEVERRLKGAQVVEEMTEPVGSVPAPEPPEEDAPTDAELSALEAMLQEIERRLPKRTP